MVATSTDPAPGAPAAAFFGDRRAPFHQAALDGLRGVAILIVLASHLTNSGLLPRPGLLGAGKAGVYLFFVLSAFLLTTGLLARPAADLRSGRTWADYALRRVLRIWPLYLAVLVASWFLTRHGIGFWPYPLTGQELAAHVLLQQGKSVLWSIPVEFQFYVWLPAVVVLLAAVRGWRAPRLTGTLLIAGLTAAAILVWPPESVRGNDVRLGPYLPVFLCGVAAGWLHVRGTRPGSTSAWALVGGIALVAAVASIPALYSNLASSDFAPGVNHRWFLFFGLVWAGLLLAVLHGPAWLRRPFETKLLRFFGIVSYSMYLLHMPVVEAFATLGWPARAVGAPVVVAAVAAVSTLSYLAFERPFQRVRVRRSAPAG